MPDQHAPGDIASGLRRSAMSAALIAFAALAALGAVGCLVALGGVEAHRRWGASGALIALGAELGLLAGVAMLARVIMRALARADRRRRERDDAEERAQSPLPAPAPGVASALDALGVRRVIESSPLLTLGALSVAALVVIGPGRLARFAVRGLRIVRTLDTLMDAARAASHPADNGRMRSESRS